MASAGSTRVAPRQRMSTPLTMAGHAARGVRDAKGCGVAEVVGGVGQEGKAAREQAADDLRRRDTQVQGEGDVQPAAVQLGRGVRTRVAAALCGRCVLVRHG